MRKMYGAAFALLLLGLLLSACGAQATAPAADDSADAVSPSKTPRTISLKPSRTPAPAQTRRPTAPRRPTLSPTISPTETVSPTWTSTATTSATPSASASPAPSATITLTPTITRTPRNPSEPTLFPMSIAAMREGSYPGSEIVLDQELAAGSNYRRYYVYYLSQGHKIYALLTIPNAEKPAGGWPGIVFNHGYIPPNEYRTTQLYLAYVDRLARSGYVIFRIDYRGHGNSEGDAKGAYGDPGYEIDVLNAVASLKRYSQVDPEKIGMWGHSMGGYLTLRDMVISKDVKVGVIWAGVVAAYPDLLYNWSEVDDNSRAWMQDWPAQFGSPELNPAFWDSISANSYLADLSGPLQLHYGTSDEYVPPVFSENLAAEIREVGGEVDINSYPNDDHNLNGYFNLAMDRTIAFFDAVLKPP